MHTTSIVTYTPMIQNVPCPKTHSFHPPSFSVITCIIFPINAIFFRRHPPGDPFTDGFDLYKSTRLHIYDEI